MKKSTYMLNTLLAAILGFVLLVAILIRTFLPRMILPHLDASAMVLISLTALLLEYYLAPGAERCYICIPVFSSVTFGLLPFAACFVGAVDALKCGLLGGAVFTAAVWIFDSMTDRISTGPASKAAPLVSAIGLYLAVQCLMGIL